MIKNPLISVIIPVYNVERYLEKCLESIINQTYGNLQIIIVDDCSSDKSLTISDKFAQKDSRICILHSNKNIGVSAARNIGIEMAQGDFISFIDADDYLDYDFYEYLITLTVLNDSGNADIVYCAYRRVSDSGSRILSQPKDEPNHVEAFCSKDAVVNCLRAQKGFNIFIWNGLFKKSILPRFVEGRITCEDQDFTIAALLNSSCVIRGWGIKYNYRIRKSGSQSIDIKTRVQHTLQSLQDVSEHIHEAGSDMDCIDAFYERSLRMDLNLIDRYSTGSLHDKQLFRTLRKRLKKDAVLTYKGIKGRLISILFYAPESLYRVVFLLIKKIKGMQLGKNN